MNFFNKLKPLLPIIILVIIELILFFTNYVPKTYFLGWDNLFPQLNFIENIKRSFFSVWEEYRGLGFLDGMSFAANLPYYIFLYIVSFFIPQDLIRYLSIFFLHLLGGIGIFYLLNNLLAAYSHKRFVSFFGALFYLYNFATVQMFYAPYELFSIHFAFLPWLVLFLIKYLESGQRRDLIAFSILSLAGASQAHVPTIFLVYILMLFSILIFYILKDKKQGFKKVIIVILITICANAFWGLPYAHFGLTNNQTTVSSKINQMSTESVYLINKARGSFIDVALMRGFWLDYTDIQNNGHYSYIMPIWRTYSQTAPFMVIGFFFFLLSIAGLIIAMAGRKQIFYPFAFTFLFCFLMLGIDIPFLNSLFNLFYNQVPLFAQIFRFTFTKFSVLYAFSSTILISLTLAIAFAYVKRSRYGTPLLIFGLTLALFYYSFPSFQGQFVYNNLRLKIPNDYLELVNYFKKQSISERIALLPQHSYWGWTYTNWGYRGSGFIWYGFPQPTLDGSTFPWSRENENYYWELDQAINSANKSYFEAVLRKYQIDWIVIDNSIISQYSTRASLITGLHDLVVRSPSIHKIKSIGKIDIFKVDQGKKQRNFVFLASSLAKIGPRYQWDNLDHAYLEKGDYITLSEEENEVFYPFRTLFTGRLQEELEFKILDKGNYFSFESKIPTKFVNGTLIVPDYRYEEILNNANSNSLKKSLEQPQLYIDDELVKIDANSLTNPLLSSTSGEIKIVLPYIHKGKLEIRVPKTSGYYDYNSQTNKDLFNRSYKSCSPFSGGYRKEEKISGKKEDIVRLSNYNSTTCFDFNLPYNPQNRAYLITVKAKNLEGKSLLLSIINNSSQKPNFESSLNKSKKLTDSYFIIPPMINSDMGYDLYFYNVSLGNVKSVNELAGIEVKEFPYDFLKRLRIEKTIATDVATPQISDIDLHVSHSNPSLYAVRIDESILSNVVLVLSQSFDSGWKAYQVDKLNFLTKVFPFVFGKEIKQHVLVNNWENGWVIASNGQQSIVIAYLPQYLEYLGIFILTTSIPLIFIYSKKLT